MVNEAMQNGTQQQFGGGNQSGFGTFAKNPPANQQQNGSNLNGANGGSSRPTSALSGSQGGRGGSFAAWGAKSFSTSRGRGRGGFGSSNGGGTPSNGTGQSNGQQENGSPARENTPQPPQRPDSQTQGEQGQQKRISFVGSTQRGGRGEFGSRPVSRQGADGTDFGDVPMKKSAGTGANTAPLGTRRGSGFGGRGSMAASNSTENAENGGDSTNTNAAENTEAEAGKENRRQTGFGGAPKMGGRGGGFGGRGGGDRNAGGGSVPNARFNGDENGGGGGRRVGFGDNASGVGGRGGGFSSRGDRENGGGGFNRGEGGGRGGFNRGGGGGFNRAEGGGGFRQPREGGDAGRFDQNGRGSRDFINRGPGARFGDFGAGFARFETSDEREIQASHVPVDRTIDEIVAEDTRVSENYKTIFDEDDECVVTGLPDGSPPQMLDNWNDASFEEQLRTNIERSKYIRPRKIQSLTIPLIMDGHDIKGHAETGSGKSAAFLLPIINLIMQRKKKGEYEPKRICPYCLIIEPTRELAYQLYDQARKLAENTGVTVSKAYGKFKVKENAREISTLGCDILVGTPGRLLHFFEVKYLECEKLKMLVLDEADQLLEDDFARILRQLPKIDGFPKIEDRQTLLFSATFAPEVQIWANDWIKKENVMVSNKKPVSANSRVVQRFEIVERGQKNTKLLELLEKEQNEAREENPANPAIKKTLVFVKMKRTADLVSTYLNCKKLKSTTINGDRSQKMREESLNDFRNGKFDIVVTTDVCARGIDIKELDHVINLDLPIDHTTYVHRIGRTGRLKEGIATSFFDPSDDMELAKELAEGLKNIGQEVPKWLEEAADGKMPMVAVPNTTMNNQQNSWGNAGFGSCFGGNDNAAAANGQQATAGNEAKNGTNDGTWGGGPEIKKEPTNENAPGNVEAPIVGNGPVQGGSRPSSAAAAAPIQSPQMVTQQNAAPPADDANDDW